MKSSLGVLAKKNSLSLKVELNTSGHARLKDKPRTLAVDIQNSVFVAPP